MLVGHTHEAVDRFFRYINQALSNAEFIVTVSQMFDVAIQSLNSSHGEFVNFDVEELRFVADWKSWSKGCIGDLHDHSLKGSPHHFQFKRDTEDGPVLMRTKYLSTDPSWIPAAGLQIVLDDPVGDPKAAPYHFLGRMESDKYLDRLEKTKAKLKTFDFLTDESETWWNEIISQNRSGIVPARFTDSSEYALKFPARDFHRTCERDEREEEERSSILTDNIRRQFGYVQPKEPYIGKRQSRAKRKEHGATLEDVDIGSFVMVKGASKKEPLFFGKVTKMLKETQEFELHYYGRADMSGYDVSGPFTPLYYGDRKGKRGQKPLTRKWLGIAPLTSVLCFDIGTKKASKQGVLKLSKSGRERCLEEIKELLEKDQSQASEVECSLANSEDEPSSSDSKHGTDSSTSDFESS